MLKKLMYWGCGILSVGLLLTVILMNQQSPQPLKAQTAEEVVFDNKKTSGFVELGKFKEHIKNSADGNSEDYYYFSSVSQVAGADPTFGSLNFKLPIGLQIANPEVIPESWKIVGEMNPQLPEDPEDVSTYMVGFYPNGGNDTLNNLIEVLKSIRFHATGDFHSNSSGLIQVFVGEDLGLIQKRRDNEFPQKWLDAAFEKNEDPSQNTKEDQVNRFIFYNVPNQVYYSQKVPNGYQSDTIRYNGQSKENSKFFKNEVETYGNVFTRSGKSLHIVLESGNPGNLVYPKGANDFVNYSLKLMPKTNYTFYMQSSDYSEGNRDENAFPQDSEKRDASAVVSVDSPVEAVEGSKFDSMITHSLYDAHNAIKPFTFSTGKSYGTEGDLVSKTLYLTTLRTKERKSILGTVTNAQETSIFNMYSKGDWYVEANKPVLKISSTSAKHFNLSLSTVIGHSLSEVVDTLVNYVDTANNNTPVKAELDISKTPDVQITEYNYSKITSVSVKSQKWGFSAADTIDISIIPDPIAKNVPQPLIIERYDNKTRQLLQKKLYDGFGEAGLDIESDSKYDLTTEAARGGLQLSGMSIVKNKGDYGQASEKGTYDRKPRVLKYYYGNGVEIGKLIEHVDNSASGDNKDYYTFDDIYIHEEMKSFGYIMIDLPYGLKIANPEINTEGWSNNIDNPEVGEYAYEADGEKKPSQLITFIPQKNGKPVSDSAEHLNEFLKKIRFVPKDPFHKAAIGKIKVYTGENEQERVNGIKKNFPNQDLAAGVKGLEPDVEKNVDRTRVDRYLYYNDGSTIHYDDYYSGNETMFYSKKEGELVAKGYVKIEDKQLKMFLLNQDSYVQYGTLLMPNTTYTLHLESNGMEQGKYYGNDQTYASDQGLVIRGANATDENGQVASLNGTMLSQNNIIKPYRFNTLVANGLQKEFFAIKPLKKSNIFGDVSMYSLNSNGNFYLEANTPKLVLDDNVINIPLSRIRGHKLSEAIETVPFYDKNNGSDPKGTVVLAKLGESQENPTITNDNFEALNEKPVTITAYKWGVSASQEVKLNIFDDGQEIAVPQPIIITKYDTKKLDQNQNPTEFSKLLYDGFKKGGIQYGAFDTNYDLTTEDQRNGLEDDRRELMRKKGSYGQDVEKGQFGDNLVELVYYYGDEVDIGDLREYINNVKGEDYYTFDEDNIEVHKKNKQFGAITFEMPKGLMIQNESELLSGDTAPLNNWKKIGDVPDMPSDSKDQSTYLIRYELEDGADQSQYDKLEQVLKMIRFVPREKFHKNAIGHVKVFIGTDFSAQQKVWDTEFPQKLLTAKFEAVPSDPKQNASNEQVNRYFFANYKNFQYYDGKLSDGKGYDDRKNIIYVNQTPYNADNFYPNSEIVASSGKALNLDLLKGGYVGFKLRLMPKTNYTMYLQSEGNKKADHSKLIFKLGTATLRKDAVDGPKIATLGPMMDSDDNLVAPYQFTTGAAEDDGLAKAVEYYITPDGTQFNMWAKGDFFVTAMKPKLVLKDAGSSNPAIWNLSDIIGRRLSEVVNQKLAFVDTNNNDTPVRATLNASDNQASGDPIITMDNYKNLGVSGEDKNSGITKISIDGEKWQEKVTSTMAEVKIVSDTGILTGELPQPIIISRYDKIDPNHPQMIDKFLYDGFVSAGISTNGINFIPNGTTYDLTTTKNREFLDSSVADHWILNEASYGQPQEKGVFKSKPILLTYNYGKAKKSLTVHYKDSSGSQIAPDRVEYVYPDDEKTIQLDTLVGYRLTRKEDVVVTNAASYQVSDTLSSVTVKAGEQDMDITVTYGAFHFMIDDGDGIVTPPEVEPGGDLHYTIKLISGMKYPDGQQPDNYNKLQFSLIYFNPEELAKSPFSKFSDIVIKVDDKNSKRNGEVVGSGSNDGTAIRFTLDKEVPNTINLTASFTAAVRKDIPIDTDILARAEVSSYYLVNGTDKRFDWSEDDIHAKVRGSLKLVSAPSRFDFGQITYKGKDVNINNPTFSGADLIVRDTRGSKADDWTLQLSVSKELTNLNNPGKKLANALRYKRSNEDKSIILNDQAQNIYTQQGGGSKDISEDWDPDGAGLKLLIDKNSLSSKGTYSGEITWNLVSGNGEGIE